LCRKHDGPCVVCGLLELNIRLKDYLVDLLIYQGTLSMALDICVAFKTFTHVYKMQKYSKDVIEFHFNVLVFTNVPDKYQ